MTVFSEFAVRKLDMNNVKIKDLESSKMLNMLSRLGTKQLASYCL